MGRDKEDKLTVRSTATFKQPVHSYDENAEDGFLGNASSSSKLYKPINIRMDGYTYGKNGERVDIGSKYAEANGQKNTVSIPGGTDVRLNEVITL